MNHGTLISEIQSNACLKAGQKQIGQYIERVSLGVHKEIGEKTHKFKLDDPQFLTDDMSTPDGQILKTAVEGFIEKLEIISGALLRTNKFKSMILPRVTKLEDSQKDFLSLLGFREQMDVMNVKIQEGVDRQLEHFRLKQKELEEQQVQQNLTHETALKNLTTEVLWRIKDAEELIKSRVPEVKVIKMIDELRLTLSSQVSIGVDKNKSFIEEKVTEVQKLIQKVNETSETSFTDLRSIVKLQDKKINFELASREQIKTLELQDS